MEMPVLIAVVVAVIGLLGTILPAVPGIPLMLISIIGYVMYDKMQHFSATFLVIVIVLGSIGIISEYLLAYIGAKFFGASKYAGYGAVVGSLFGLMILPPFGLILGAMAGAVAGEFYKTKDLEKSIHAAWGTIIGLISGSIFRFFIALTIFIMFIYKIY